MADDDDNDAMMLSATYCDLMHINLYWSLIGSSSSVLPAPRRSEQRSLCVNASIKMH